MTWLDSLELEADLSRCRILTGLALNLVTGVILVGVGYVVRLTLGPTGVSVAILVGFGVAYGIVAYLVYRYVTRRRAAPSEP